MIAAKNLFCKVNGHKYKSFHMAPGTEEKNYLTRCERCHCRLLVKTLWNTSKDKREVIAVEEQKPTPRKK